MMDTNSEYPQLLLRLLCSKITGFTDDALHKSFQRSIVTLASNISATYTGDEFALTEKIKRKLVRQRHEKEAVYFAELYRKFQSCQEVRNRWSVLYLLFRMTESSMAKTFPKFTGASGDFIASTPQPGTPLIPHNHSLPSTIHPSNHHNFLPSLLSSRMREVTMNSTSHASKTHASQSASTSFLPPKTSNQSKHKPHKYNSDYDERDLLRDVLYSMQSIQGASIKYVPSHKAFRIPHDVNIPAPVKRLAHRLSEMGFLFARVRDFVTHKTMDPSFGLVGQSLCSALQQELTDYYRVMAILEAQLNQDRGREGLTLRRIEASMQQTFFKITTLASLVDACQGKKGGELASVVYLFSQHGDPLVQHVATNTLNRVSQPIFQMITDWIYKGQLENSHHEFLVSEDPTVIDEHMWRDKYSLRKNMLPSFITPQQANKILLTGKSIHFLRSTCGDRTVMMDKEEVKRAHTNQVDTIFRQDQDSRFCDMIDVTYKHTSSYLLHVLYNTYKLMQHIKAMRKYILLGQGDFIRHLMDLLEEDLDKPAQTLFLHNLAGILETAIRSTNAQYEDPEIISRLDVMLLQMSPGDTGWDVFSLRYHVSGHVGTVFSNECMLLYRRVFNFLWRAKRMEYVLASSWKLNVLYSKSLRQYKEFAPLMHSCYLLGSEMMHLVQQIQYYINFEVLECSWVELTGELEEACDLDQVILAHQHFINTVFSRALLDSMSSPILTQLRSLFDLILQFQGLQKHLYEHIDTEVDARKIHATLKTAQQEEGAEREEDRRSAFVTSFLPSCMSKVRVLSQSYKKMVEQFLSLVGTFGDVSLRCLIFRLNFSEYYLHHHPQTGRNSRISVPFSSMQQNLKSNLSRIKAPN